jgi:hypothetical protein
MQNMSFFKTIQQIIDETKTVTRRLGWWKLKPGDLLCAVEKCQGLKKGERIKRLKIIRVISVRKERLFEITDEDVRREGFPGKSREWFIDFFMRFNKCTCYVIVNRIEFEYIKE